MTKRRTATPVSLTDEQRQRLERLWFYYGNYGPQTTPGNHQFIQRILEQGIDIRPLITKRSRKSEIPTEECEAAVERVLAMGSNTIGDNETDDGSRLQVISSPEVEQQHPRLEVDPKLKEILDDMKRRYVVGRRKLEIEDDAPDAA